VKALVDCHPVESWARTGFLALVSRFWPVKEFAPVVLVSFGDFGILIFALINKKGAFRGSEWVRVFPKLGNPPLLDIGALTREPLQALENAQEIFCDVGMGVRLALRNEGTESG
jgi:hypothetical protein